MATLKIIKSLMALTFRGLSFYKLFAKVPYKSVTTIVVYTVFGDLSLKKIITLKSVCLFSAIILFFCSCNTLNVFEKVAAFNKHEWQTSNKPTFTFTIQDTTSLYNIYVVIRHADAYHYNNLWLNITTTAPNSKPINQQVELTLANNTKGWLGTGMDDIFDHRIRITNAPITLKKGNYYFSLQHTMREDPLPYVLSAGIRVEKVEQ